MASNASERLKALQERAAAMVSRPAQSGATDDGSALESAVAAASVHFGGGIDQLVRDRAIVRIPVSQIAPDMRPDMRQARLLPLPEQLLSSGEAVSGYHDLVAELLALGESLKERQIQPIVIFSGTSDVYPQARYLILVGQRRWTAAHLVQMETLDAVIVDPPAPAERVLIQYVENEEREEFSDMERAWSLHQMKQVLEDAPWEEVETRLQMSRARRQQLLRLMAFSSEQQRRVALLRLQETQVRTLHSALRAGELTSDQVDGVLERLARIAVERTRSLADEPASEKIAGNGSSRRAGIDGPTVARLVARARRERAPLAESQATPRWMPLLCEQLQRTARGLQRSLDRAEALGEKDAAALRTELLQVHGLLQSMLERVARDDQG